MPQRSGSTTAVTEARRSVAQVEAGREQLAGRVMSQSLDVELDPGRGRQIAGLMRSPVRIPWTGAHRIVGEDVGVLRQHEPKPVELSADRL